MLRRGTARLLTHNVVTWPVSDYRGRCDKAGRQARLSVSVRRKAELAAADRRFGAGSSKMPTNGPTSPFASSSDFMLHGDPRVHLSGLHCFSAGVAFQSFPLN